MDKRAYSIEELVKNGPEGRTNIYKAIKEGRLIARKAGRRTVVLVEDYDAYLKALPIVDRKAERAA